MLVQKEGNLTFLQISNNCSDLAKFITFCRKYNLVAPMLSLYIKLYLFYIYITKNQKYLFRMMELRKRNRRNLKFFNGSETSELSQFLKRFHIYSPLCKKLNKTSIVQSSTTLKFTFFYEEGRLNTMDIVSFISFLFLFQYFFSFSSVAQENLVTSLTSTFLIVILVHSILNTSSD